MENRLASVAIFSFLFFFPFFFFEQVDSPSQSREHVTATNQKNTRQRLRKLCGYIRRNWKLKKKKNMKHHIWVTPLESWLDQKDGSEGVHVPGPI